MVNARVDALVGDGFCHDMVNNPGCIYDQGDCCLSNITTNHCTDCECYFLETFAARYYPSLGDGYCNDDTNIEGLFYNSSHRCVLPTFCPVKLRYKF